MTFFSVMDTAVRVTHWAAVLIVPGDPPSQTHTDALAHFPHTHPNTPHTHTLTMHIQLEPLKGAHTHTEPQTDTHTINLSFRNIHDQR